MSLDSLFGSSYGYSSNPFSSMFDGMDSIFGGLRFLSVAMIIILILVVAVVYFLRGYALLKTGRKAGISEEINWMPFVPFAQSAYRYKILGEPVWKLTLWTDHMFYAAAFAIFLFLTGGSFGTYDASLLGMALLYFALAYLFAGRLLTLLLWFILMVTFISVPGAPVGLTIYAVFVFVYLAVSFAFRFIYTRNLYKIFHISPLFAMNIFVPFGGIVATVFEYLIAFTDNYRIDGKSPKEDTGRSDVQRMVNHGSIVGVSGMYRNATIDIPAGEEIFIGRDAVEVHVIIDQDTERISRKHCGIRYNTADGSYIVTDYSTNGTYGENGSRLPSNMPVSMPRGALIVLGSRQVSFRLN